MSRPTIRPAEELLGTVCQLPTWGRDSAPTLLPKWCCHRGNETNCESEFSCTPKVQICICHINSLPYLNLSHLTYCPENKSHRVKIALFRHKLHQCISHFFFYCIQKLCKFIIHHSKCIMNTKFKQKLCEVKLKLPECENLSYSA